MSAFVRLALMIGLIASSEGALAADDASPRCVGVPAHPLRAVQVVNPNTGHTQWAYLRVDASAHYLRGVQVVNANTAHTQWAYLPDGQSGADFFVDDGQVCTPMPAPTELLSMNAARRHIRSTRPSSRRRARP